MSILLLNDTETSGKINIDELYTRKQKQDQNQLSIFNKLLHRIQKKIQLTGKIKLHEKYIWYVVPEFIFGEANYDQGDCIAYLMAQLQENGFLTKYIHPNTLFISWQNFIPTYVRNELKKKTGIAIDEKGNRIDLNNDAGGTGGASDENAKPKKQFTPIEQYKPKGDFIYNPDIFDTISKKVSWK